MCYSLPFYLSSSLVFGLLLQLLCQLLFFFLFLWLHPFYSADRCNYTTYNFLVSAYILIFNGKILTLRLMHLAIDRQFCHEIWLHCAGFCGLCSTTSMDPARHPEGQRAVWKWDERGAVQQMSGWVCSADGSWNSAWRWPDGDWGKGKLSVMQEDDTTFCIITALGCCMRECFLLWLVMQWK